MCNSSKARPRSSGDVVMKKNEKDDINTRNLNIIVKENVKVEPVIKFARKISIAKNEPPLMEKSHLLKEFAKRIIGI
jgi:hypothetical protein